VGGIVNSTSSKRAKAKGHHFNPRFLLNNFASRRSPSGEDYYAWVFRSGHDPIESNTRDIAKQRYFHGNPETSSLESLIADEESKYAELLQRIKAIGITDADVSKVRELIVHLAIRTKNLRDGFAHLSREFFSLAGEMLTSTDKKARQRRSRQMIRAAYRELQKPATRNALSHLPPHRQKALRELIIRQAKTGNMGEATQNYVAALTQMLPEKAKEIAKNAHLSSLNQGIAPKKRVEALSTLHWRVLPAENESFVLGDVLTIGKIESCNEFVHPIKASAEDQLVLVALPIAPNLAILGSTTPSSTITPAEINLASVELSREQFIANRATEAERALVNRLGLRADLYTSEEMREMLK